jgi:hypothetical protein
MIYTNEVSLRPGPTHGRSIASSFHHYPRLNKETRIRRTLLSVEQYLPGQGYDFEVIVINDGSRDKTADMDADNSTTIDLIEKAWPLFGQGCDLVIQVLAVPGIWDTQCGFKVFSAKAAEGLRCSIRAKAGISAGSLSPGIWR